MCATNDGATARSVDNRGYENPSIFLGGREGTNGGAT